MTEREVDKLMGLRSITIRRLEHLDRLFEQSKAELRTACSLQLAERRLGSMRDVNLTLIAEASTQKDASRLRQAAAITWLIVAKTTAVFLWAICG